jgi:type I restriction enzyme S subunit
MNLSASDLPLDWQELAIGELLRLSNGINADKSAYGSGVPFANVLEVITYESITESDVPGRISVGPKVLRRYEVKHGDVLSNRTSETQAEVGLSSIYVGTEPVVFGGFVLRGRPLTDELTQTYSKYAFRSPSVRNQIVARGQGGIRANIGQRDLKTVTVRLPSHREQSAIAEALDDVSALVSGLERMLTKKIAIRQGALQQLLTGRTRRPGFTDQWAWRQFHSVMSRLNAKRYQVPASQYGAVGRLPVVDQGQQRVIGYTDELALGFDPGEGGVIVFGDHTCITKFVDFRFAIGADGTQILRANPGISTRFMAYALENDPVASTGYNRHYKFLREKVLPVPSLYEQNAIVETLGDASSEIRALRDRLRKARDLKRGMMQELLTGHTRLLLTDAAT